MSSFSIGSELQVMNFERVRFECNIKKSGVKMHWNEPKKRFLVGTVKIVSAPCPGWLYLVWNGPGMDVGWTWTVDLDWSLKILNYKRRCLSVFHINSFHDYNDSQCSDTD